VVLVFLALLVCLGIMMILLRWSSRDSLGVARRAAGLALAESKSAENDGNRGGLQAVLGSTAGSLRLFFYLADAEVHSLYSQLGEAESVPSSRDLEQQTAGGISLGIRGWGADVGGKRDRTSKILSSFEPESDPNRMYVAVERRLVIDGELTAVDLLTGFDVAPLARFERLVNELQATEGFKFPPGAVSSIRASWGEYQEAQGAQRLSMLTGYVAIRADYQVSPAREGELVLQASVGSARAASVNVHCDEKWMRSSGRTAIIPGADIRATCVGKIIRWSEAGGKLIVLPVAVF
jgi:hypothetical protein